MNNRIVNTIDLRWCDGVGGSDGGNLLDDIYRFNNGEKKGKKYIYLYVWVFYYDIDDMWGDNNQTILAKIFFRQVDKYSVERSNAKTVKKTKKKIIWKKYSADYTTQITPRTYVYYTRKTRSAVDKLVRR